MRQSADDGMRVSSQQQLFDLQSLAISSAACRGNKTFSCAQVIGVNVTAVYLAGCLRGLGCDFGMLLALGSAYRNTTEKKGMIESVFCHYHFINGKFYKAKRIVLWGRSTITQIEMHFHSEKGEGMDIY